MNADNKTELMKKDVHIHSRSHLQDLFSTARIDISLTVAVARENWCGLQKRIYSQSCVSGNKKLLLWVVHNVGHKAMWLTSFASEGYRTVFILWLLMEFLLGFEEFITYNEVNKLLAE